MNLRMITYCLHYLIIQAVHIRKKSTCMKYPIVSYINCTPLPVDYAKINMIVTISSPYNVSVCSIISVYNSICLKNATTLLNSLHYAVQSIMRK